LAGSFFNTLSLVIIKRPAAKVLTLPMLFGKKCDGPKEVLKGRTSTLMLRLAKWSVWCRSIGDRGRGGWPCRT
jgi:hypothetical protein